MMMVIEGNREATTSRDALVELINFCEEEMNFETFIIAIPRKRHDHREFGKKYCLIKRDASPGVRSPDDYLIRISQGIVYLRVETTSVLTHPFLLQYKQCINSVQILLKSLRMFI